MTLELQDWMKPASQFGARCCQLHRETVELHRETVEQNNSGLKACQRNCFSFPVLVALADSNHHTEILWFSRNKRMQPDRCFS